MFTPPPFRGSAPRKGNWKALCTSEDDSDISTGKTTVKITSKHDLALLFSSP